MVGAVVAAIDDADAAYAPAFPGRRRRCPPPTHSNAARASPPYPAPAPTGASVLLNPHLRSTNAWQGNRVTVPEARCTTSTAATCHPAPPAAPPVSAPSSPAPRPSVDSLRAVSLPTPGSSGYVNASALPLRKCVGVCGGLIAPVRPFSPTSSNATRARVPETQKGDVWKVTR